jgi:hypothetical protein
MDTTARPDYSKIKLIACATVMEEILPSLPPDLSFQRLDFGLHNDPDKLRTALQQAIDSVEPHIQTILLGYGLCSRAVAGLKSHSCTIIIPRVDDCIGIFLGSAQAYHAQHTAAPGTLYQTKGWLESDDTLQSLPDLIKRYGETRAKRLFHAMFKNYDRLVFINTGNYQIEHYRQLSREKAAELNLRFEEIQGSNRLVKKLIAGPWDEEFVVVEPGREVRFADFR